MQWLKLLFPKIIQNVRFKEIFLWCYSLLQILSKRTDRRGLLSLPEEVIGHLAEFLGPQELFALSATCHSLRAYLNDDSIWRKYSHTGSLSLGLRDITSIVPPTFSEPDEQSSSLEPHCEHRMHVMRQNRLLRNFRRGDFVEHTVNVEDKNCL